MFLYFWPFLIILVVIGIMIRVVIFFAFAWTAMKQINQFQRQLDGIVLNLPPPGSYPSSMDRRSDHIGYDLEPVGADTTGAIGEPKGRYHGDVHERWCAFHPAVGLAMIAVM